MNIQSFIDRLENNRPLLEDIGVSLVSDIRRNFDDESDPLGNPWNPLEDSTLNKKRARGYILDILQERGGLLASIDKAITESSVIVGPDTGPSGTRSDLKAKAHHTGFRNVAAGRFVEARRYVGVGEQSMDKIRDLIRGYWFGS